MYTIATRLQQSIDYFPVIAYGRLMDDETSAYVLQLIYFNYTILHRYNACINVVFKCVFNCAISNCIKYIYLHRPKFEVMLLFSRDAKPNIPRRKCKDTQCNVSPGAVNRGVSSAMLSDTWGLRVGVVWCGVVQCRVVQCSVVQCSVVQCDVVWYDVAVRSFENS